MKKRDIWISVVIYAVGAIFLYYIFGGSGFIKVENPEATVQFRSGFFGYKGISGDKPIKVRAQTYRPAMATLTRKDGSKQWILDSYGPWGQLRNVRVPRDKTVTIKLGPPFIVQPDISQRGDTLHIGLSLIGQSGESWSPVARNNKGSLSAPTYKII
ncbi:MAG: hypothetical protein ACYTE8_07625, partial [Planctomycetota bacterium]